MKGNQKKFIAGFTLAEVLITLGIIGIVAEITIPTLMQNVQDQQFKAAWKKGYSVIAQATENIKMDNGGMMIGTITGADQMKELYKQYLHKTQDCNSSDSSCVYTQRALNATAYSSVQRAILYLNDGSMFIFNYGDTNCNTKIGSSGIPCCGSIVVDVNGQKSPNTVGKDIYGAYVTSNRVLPFGTEGDAGNFTGCQGTSGWGCSAEVLYK